MVPHSQQRSRAALGGVDLWRTRLGLGRGVGQGLPSLGAALPPAPAPGAAIRIVLGLAEIL